MREKIRDINRLRHILLSCTMLIENKEHDTIDDLRENPIKFYGYVKLVEIIGEATFKLTKEFRESHSEIPWNMMEGMRHVLVHEYYNISADKLWATVEDDIPQLKPLIEKLIEEQEALV